MSVRVIHIYIGLHLTEYLDNEKTNKVRDGPADSHKKSVKCSSFLND